VARRRIRITASGIRRIVQHLEHIDAATYPPNAGMLERLRAGKTELQDVNFCEHELHEAELVRRGVDLRAAHLATLSWQGIVYEPGYERQLYHPEVIRANARYFSRAARR
jgi:hypothetical protein